MGARNKGGAAAILVTMAFRPSRPRLRRTTLRSRPVLDQRIGQHIIGFVRGAGIEWDIGRKLGLGLSPLGKISVPSSRYAVNRGA
jgi:hypothetical protein